MHSERRFFHCVSLTNYRSVGAQRCHRETLREWVRQDQADPLKRPAVDRMIASAGDTGRALCNAALLTVRRHPDRPTELVALDSRGHHPAERWGGQGDLRRSKSDKASEGAVFFLAIDTMEWLSALINAAGIEGGALFQSVNKGGAIGGRLHDRDVPRILKAMAKAAGHSARVGVTWDMTAAGIRIVGSDPSRKVCGRPFKCKHDL